MSAAAQVLSHEINHGYKYSVLPVETFNGASVHNMAHLAAMVDTCEQPYLNFGLEGGRFITLDRQQVGHKQTVCASEGFETITCSCRDNLLAGPPVF
jgi:hypothetical protein